MKNKKHTRQQFIDASANKAFDKKHRATIAYNMHCYDTAVKNGLTQFANLDRARKRAAIKKHAVLENLENHLKTFEMHVSNHGGKVLYASGKDEANAAILQILEKEYIKLVVKSKSMTTEETGLTTFLEKNGIECVETDLGEYIVQVSEDRPYHIVTPAMHLSAKEVATIFHKHFGWPEHAAPPEITSLVRKKLRNKFLHAQAAITGANFLVAETGGVAITENEGNALMAVSFPRIHIVVAGIEKLIGSLEDLDLFWPLLASHGTGQKLTAYNTIIHGPRQDNETDGPEQLFVILLDNGRTRLLSAIPQRRALSCIRCGACLNACPVYRNIGGHAYGTVYTGPVGAVISPFLSEHPRETIHLSHASSLCGKCTDVCPAGIDLHHQLLQNRRMAVKRKLPPTMERLAMNMYVKTMKKAKRVDMFSPGIKNLFASLFFRRSWGRRRTLPQFKTSFRKSVQ